MKALNPFLVLALLASPGWAQVTTATVYGQVTDPSGAGVPGGAITLTHVQTGAVVTKIASETGDFQFDFLRTGTYRVVIESKGFKRFESQGLELAAGQSVRQTFPLQIGDLAETVRVEGTAPLVNTATSK